MQLPWSAVIGAHTYRIDGSAETARLLRDDETRADSRPDQLLVRIDQDRPHTAVAETLLHELMHCAWHQSALRVIEDPSEEQVVSALAPLLLEMLRRNPGVVGYLVGGEAAKWLTSEVLDAGARSTSEA